jgi:ABC-type glutathione transport system ATPase component
MIIAVIVLVLLLAAPDRDRPRRSPSERRIPPCPPTASMPEPVRVRRDRGRDPQHLEKRFGAFRAVAGISFTVRRGEIFGLLGPNGAGKSTTIRMLCGLLRPTAGAGRVAGFDIVRDTEKIKTRIGYMSQRFSLYDELTVEENIDFYSGIYRLPREKKAARKDWVLAMAGLQDHRQARTGRTLRRLETAPRPRLRRPARAADPVPRRAHVGRRSQQPAPASGT